MNARLRTLSAWALVAVCTLFAAHGQEEFPADRDSEDAKQVVERYRAIAVEQPVRAAEIEAYLYPLTRDLAELPAEPDPPTVEEKTMFFVRGPGGLRAVRAEAVEKDGDVLIITAENGSKAIVQTASVAGELPWFSNKDLESGAMDLEELAASYDGIAARAPSLRQFLEAEARRFRAILRKREAADHETEQELRAKVDAVTTEVFDASTNPSSAELSHLLVEAEAVIVEHPEVASTIDAWAAPFREHLGRLLVGDEWTAGKWVTATERREREERERAIRAREGISYSVGAEMASDAAIRDALKSPVWIAGGLFLLAGGALAMLRNPAVRTVATMVLVAVPLGLALVFYLASREAAGIPEVPPSATDEHVVDLIVTADGGTPVPEVVKQDEINAFLARRLRIEGRGDGLSRRAQVVKVSPGRIAVFELARGWGFDWVVRCDFAWLVENGVSSLEVTSVWIGGLPCPPALAAAVAANIQTEFGGVLAQSGLLRTFTPGAPEDGQIAISPTVHAEARLEADSR